MNTNEFNGFIPLRDHITLMDRLSAGTVAVIQRECKY